MAECLNALPRAKTPKFFVMDKRKCHYVRSQKYRWQSWHHERLKTDFRPTEKKDLQEDLAPSFLPPSILYLHHPYLHFPLFSCFWKEMCPRVSDALPGCGGESECSSFPPFNLHLLRLQRTASCSRSSGNWKDQRCHRGLSDPWGPGACAQRFPK